MSEVENDKKKKTPVHNIGSCKMSGDVILQLFSINEVLYLGTMKFLLSAIFTKP